MKKLKLWFLICIFVSSLYSLSAAEKSYDELGLRSEAEFSEFAKALYQYYQSKAILVNITRRPHLKNLEPVATAFLNENKAFDQEVRSLFREEEEKRNDRVRAKVRVPGLNQAFKLAWMDAVSVRTSMEKENETVAFEMLKKSIEDIRNFRNKYQGNIRGFITFPSWELREL